MNIKSLLLGSTLVLGSLFGSVTPAEAKAADCWLAAPNETATAVYCDHFLPEVGEHVVFMTGNRFEFHLYKGGEATIYVNGQSGARGTWSYHSEGGIQVVNSYNGYWFVFDR